MNRSSKFKHLTLDLICAVLLILFDQYTKNLAVEKLKDKAAYVIIDKVFVLSYLENRGAAFGMMQNKQWFFLIVSSIFIVGIVIILYRLPLTKKFYIAEVILVFLIAGAIGNMIDRIANNYVVDFFYFVLIDFPVFNVADIYVTVSAVALFFFIMFGCKEEDLDFIKLKKSDKG